MTANNSNHKATTILILGGYGNAGRQIAELLLKEKTTTTCINKIIIAGRDLSRAQKFAHELNEMDKSNVEDTRVLARKVDASCPESLECSFKEDHVDMVVVASSTSKYTCEVMDAALKANVDYFDIMASSSKVFASSMLRKRIEESDRLFVIEGGFHPGIPAALIRYAAAVERDAVLAKAEKTQHLILQQANVYIVMSPNWKDLSFSEETENEFFLEIGEMGNEVYDAAKKTNKASGWEKQGWTVMREYDFGEPFHKQQCVPLFLEELRDLPTNIPTLQQVGMYISGFDPVTTFVVLPIAMVVAAIVPKTWNSVMKVMSKLFSWSLKTFASPPFGAVIALEAHYTQQSVDGGCGGDEATSAAAGPPTITSTSACQKEQAQETTQAVLSVSVSHEDAYFLTAVPAVACILQLLDFRNSDRDDNDKSEESTLPQIAHRHPTGLYFQSHVVEPMRFIADMERLGLNVSISMKPGKGDDDSDGDMGNAKEKDA